MRKEPLGLCALIAIVVIAAFSAHRGAITEPGTARSLPSASQPIVIMAAGDIMLDRTVRAHIEQEGSDYPFTQVPKLFDGADIVVGNLEGSFTDNPSVSIRDHSVLHFTFDPALIQELARRGFDVLSLANNHSLDFGQAGYTATVRYLDAAGIQSFGSPSNDMRLSAIIWAHGRSIAFVGYHALYDPDTASVVQEIASLQNKADLIIVYPHWGVEYNLGYTADQQAEAHAFIDAGADIVIGSHPHVIEPVEVYQGKAIFYSLGNFVFDQDFSPETERGLVVRVSVGSEGIAYGLIPVILSRGKLSLATEEETQSVLDRLAVSSLVTEKIRQSIHTGTFTLD